MVSNKPIKKKQYLAVYDYGMGGIWSVINARSKEEITALFPEFTVYDENERPTWITEEEYNRILSQFYLDIDQEPTGWFANFLRLRSEGKS